MSNRLYFAFGHEPQREPIEELSGVRLRQAIDCEGGRLPAGASGTIVAVHAAGEAYSVEFEEPFHALVSLPLYAASAEARSHPLDKHPY